MIKYMIRFIGQINLFVCNIKWNLELQRKKCYSTFIHSPWGVRIRVFFIKKKTQIGHILNAKDDFKF